VAIDVHDIVERMKTEPATLRLRQGVVTAIAADGSVSLTIAGSTTVVAGVKVLSGACPLPGAACWIATDGKDLFVLGHLAPIGPAHVRLERPTAQSTSSATNTIVDFTASPANLDDGWGMFDSGATDRVSIVVPGLYMVTGSLRWEANATGYRQLSLLVSGTEKRVVRELAVGSSTGYQEVTCQVRCVQEDYLQLQARQTSGGSLSLEVQSGCQELSATWLGP